MSVTSLPPQTLAIDRLETPSDPRATEFAENGYLGPVRLFSTAECRRIAAYIRRDSHPAPADWMKGRAVHERFLYELATHPSLMSMLRAVLGEDIILWGVYVVSRRPGDIHPWHSDIESSDPKGRFATAWIGLEHTNRQSALQLISRSHRLGKTVQEVRQERGVRRVLATPEELLNVAREFEPEAELLQPEMTNGDAILFDGRLWHGSDNTRKWRKRTALLFQYAAADRPVRIPDPSHFDWPFRHRTAPRPAAILVSGTERVLVNRLVPPPPPSSKGSPMVTSTIHQFVLPLENPTKSWERCMAFRGPTRTLTGMSCHASVLTGRQIPHPPHTHPEDELLIPLHGEMELLIAKSPDDPEPRVERITPCSFVYYPSGQHHSLRNPGDEPICYMMFKWSAPEAVKTNRLPHRIYQYGNISPPPDASPFWTRQIFEGPTACLRKLHAHLTVLQPGAGYKPHVDAYDVAIVVLSGTLETLGQVVEPLSVIYYSAGEPHGMKNIGTEPARYLVFEFHATSDTRSTSTPIHRTIARKLRKFAKRLARPVWHRIRPGRSTQSVSMTEDEDAPMKGAIVSKFDRVGESSARSSQDPTG